MQIDRSIAHFVLLGDDATTNLKSLSVSHSLVLSDTLHQNMMPADGANSLHLHDIARVVKTQNLVASNALTFTMDTQPRVSILNVGHSLSLWHLLKKEAGGAKSALTLSQTVVVAASKGTRNTLALSHAVTLGSITRNYNVSDVLGLSHSVNAYIPKRGFSQFTITIPALQDVRFYLPGVVDETFRPPQFGNADELVFQRVNRRSRGGDLIIFRDNEWPMTETLRLQFDFPCQSDADRLLNVLRQTIGRYLQYTDHEGTSWIGVITNPDSARIQAGRNTFQVEVTIEVEKVPTLSALIVDVLNFTQSAQSNASRASQLALAQAVGVTVVRSRSGSHTLSLSQQAKRVYPARNTLVLSQFASWLNVIDLDSGFVTHEVAVAKTLSREVSQSLTFGETAQPSTTLNLSPAQTLAMYSEVPAVNYHFTIHQRLSFSQSLASPPKERSHTHGIIFTQEVRVNGTFLRSFEHELDLTPADHKREGDYASWLNPIHYLYLTDDAVCAYTHDGDEYSTSAKRSPPGGNKIMGPYYCTNFLPLDPQGGTLDLEDLTSGGLDYDELRDGDMVVKWNVAGNTKNTGGTIYFDHGGNVISAQSGYTLGEDFPTPPWDTGSYTFEAEVYCSKNLGVGYLTVTVIWTNNFG